MDPDAHERIAAVESLPLEARAVEFLAAREALLERLGLPAS